MNPTGQLVLLDGAHWSATSNAKRQVYLDTFAEFAKTVEPFTVTFKVMMSDFCLYRHSLSATGNNGWCLAMLRYVHERPIDHAEYAKDLYVTARTISRFVDKLHEASGDPRCKGHDNAGLSEDDYEMWFTLEMDHDFTVRVKVEPTAKCPSETARILREGVVDIDPVWNVMTEVTGYICLYALSAELMASDAADNAENQTASHSTDTADGRVIAEADDTNVLRLNQAACQSTDSDDKPAIAEPDDINVLQLRNRKVLRMPANARRGALH
ncbi:unnamed protein product [Oreochromis niloticus]|nr:unnamed protein product [Mustela putorius furo]CAI5677810.1 unnamed protein product [Mustela putorius furo]